ncbi:MAG TPA: hypothetical protein VGI96_01890 [Streptosporangiaceae bacterium]|jgi:hypothetical protein
MQLVFPAAVVPRSVTGDEHVERFAMQVRKYATFEEQVSLKMREAMNQPGPAGPRRPGRACWTR